MSKFKTPIVEATGTGAGVNLFCLGVGEKYPDLVNASRKISSSELKKCQDHGIKSVIEIKIGYDGIVLANSNHSPKYNLSKKQIFLALAQEVPFQGKLIKNPYQKWSEIDESLPNKEIIIYGPPPTSGTRDAFVELVMEEPCMEIKEFISEYKDKKNLKNICHIIRSDGKFIEAGENDNLIIQKLRNNSDALGIFGFSSLEENHSIIQAVMINGVMPSYENIINNKYKVSRPLFVYLKKEHLDLIPGIKDFAREIINPDAISEEGYLIEKGLIPMSKKELDVVRGEVSGNL
jgi:phosphate transport system substrate-binding protein